MANIKRANTSGITKSGTAISDVPDAPTIGTATAGDSSATVTFTAAATGGAATSYTATSNPGSITGSSATSPITVSGLTNGTSYTFTVKGTNSTATGPASAASNSVTPVTTIVGMYESIATVTVGSSSVSYFDFTNIPQTYTHLQIRAINRNSWSTLGFSGSFVYPNNDQTGSNYSWHRLVGDGSGVYAYGEANAYTGGGIFAASGGNTTGIFAVGIMDILDYTNTNKYKTIKVLTGGEANDTNGALGIYSVLWKSTSAITSLRVVSAQANMVQYTRFALYGIKG